MAKETGEKIVLELSNITPYTSGVRIKLSANASKTLKEQYGKEVAKLVDMALRTGYRHGRASVVKQLDRERVARREAFEKVSMYKATLEKLGNVKDIKELASNMYKISEYDTIRERYQKKCKDYEILSKRYKLLRWEKK